VRDGVGFYDGLRNYYVGCTAGTQNITVSMGYSTSVGTTNVTLYGYDTGNQADNSVSFTIENTAPVCGDGYTNFLEGCDDSNTNNNDGCSSTCSAESGWSCMGSPSSCSTVCGDSVWTAPYEDCDGGAWDSLSCDSDCTNVTCGDSHINNAAGEQCDDGNAFGGDGCDGSCQIEGSSSSSS
jgi:cysteine-rich repeat protein